MGTSSFIFDLTHNETPYDDPIFGNVEANGIGVNINGYVNLVDLAYSVESDYINVGVDLYTMTILASFSHFETIEVVNNFLLLQGQWALSNFPMPSVRLTSHFSKANVSTDESNRATPCITEGR